MNIYDEAFNDLLKYFHENKPIENIDDTLVKIEHCLEHAKKVEELLEAYRCKDNNFAPVNDYYDNRIKKIEKELEEMK